MDDVARERKSRVPTWLFCVLFACALSIAALRGAAAEPPKTLTRDELIGVWRLVRIDYSGPHGSTVDPFYQSGSSGLLIYDRSGWMSVDIEAPHRTRFEVPGRRIGAQVGKRLARLKVSAFDSYYSYHGTWDFNAATGELAHHVAASLLPAESGKTYVQSVTLAGGDLVFTNRSGARGRETVRRKIWERVGGN